MRSAHQHAATDELELREPARANDHQLGVQDGAIGHLRPELWELARQARPVPRSEPDFAIADADEDAVAVPLDLVPPPVSDRDRP